MTNPLRGEVPLVLGDLRLTLKMGVNTLCAAESVLGKKAAAILDDMEDKDAGPALDTVRMLIWAGLRKHHHAYSPNEIGELIEEHGPAIFTNAILDGLASAFGTTEGKQGQNPPKRRKKTGTG